MTTCTRRLLTVLILAWPLTAARADEPDVYLRQIKPLLRERCFACHGALKQRAGLRLDAVSLMLQGGDAGAVVVRGQPDESELLARVMSTEPGERMPPEHEGEPLSAEQVQLLRGWIEQGAPAPADEQPEADPREHWAFRVIQRPAVPAVREPGRVRNPIDAFLEQRLEQEGLVPQPDAPRAILLRRLTIDLIGVPPTPEEYQAVEQDPQPDWYERAVERLLEDPRHGERWARHWMDIWRYSDWWGLGDQLRNSQKHIWHYRDWLIEALNDDLPYDEMVRQMLAADELYPNDLGRLRATGFLARNYFLFNRNQWMEETVEHVGKGLLGLTLNCAKCHDHKYDPIEQADFYRMRAFFEPYHVRLDVVPGETDLARDGIPRVFDGHPDLPTYLFVRGQESAPDRSREMRPAVPALLAFADLELTPVPLPAEAWQPARRAWVIGDHLAAAAEQTRQAEAALQAVRAQMPDSSAELQRAGLAVALALAEQASLEQRAAAMRASWARQDAGESAPATTADGNAPPLSPLQQAERTAAEAAVKAERDLTLARARQQVDEVEQRLAQAADDKQDALNKELSAAREAVTKAEQQVAEVGEQYTRLAGAAWTPTRFFNSGKDDPTVEFIPQSTGRRSALARWLTDRRQPLTARVAVNHLWLRHLGAPLVPTVFDFGRKGTRPVHPELVDWLAAEFMESGWSIRHMHRLIVTSSAYRRSSSNAGREVNVAHDVDNRFWWRAVPVRLESQVVRDSILSLAGRLDDTRGGPPVLPADQPASNRRSLYFFHSNNERNLFLTTFDEALVKDCYRREQSIVPQQALALTNSSLVLDAAPQIAGRISTEAIEEDAFVRRAFRDLLAITATDAELAASRRALAAWRELTPGDPAAEAAARGKLVWVLLNHNDFLTVR